MTVKYNEPMRDHTTLKIGGEVRKYCVPASVEELRQLVTGEERFLILGNGSNMLFEDGFHDLTVISTAGLDGVSVEGGKITAQCGATLSRIASEAKRASLAGMEFAHGIPGTLGGAVYMNAGAYGGEMKNIVESVTVLRRGELVTVPNEECGFGYRHSVFEETGDVIVSAVIALGPGDPDEIQAKMRELMERRRDKQPLEWPSAGSTFKRPETGYAAQMIDEAGLKGFAVGGAQVSEKHAGFLINRGGATFEDFRALMETVREKVRAQTGTLLEPEVRIIRRTE